jgi:Leucine-rich repeat (LRR) protein
MYNGGYGMKHTFNHIPLIGLAALLVLVGLSCSQSGPTSQSNTGQSANQPVNVAPNPSPSAVASTGTQLSPGLDLSHQSLTKLPDYVLSRTDLKQLDISYNNLTGALPAEIRHLTNLQVLNMSHNKMTGIPAEVGQLSQLTELDLSYNQFTGLPYELGNLKNLKRLILTGNDYAQADLDVILKNLPNVQVIK